MARQLCDGRNPNGVYMPGGGNGAGPGMHDLGGVPGVCGDPFQSMTDIVKKAGGGALLCAGHVRPRYASSHIGQLEPECPRSMIAWDAFMVRWGDGTTHTDPSCFLSSRWMRAAGISFVLYLTERMRVVQICTVYHFRIYALFEMLHSSAECGQLQVRY